MYSETQYELAMSLLHSPLSNREVARRTGVSRGTIRNWRIGGRPMHMRQSRADPVQPLKRPTDLLAYSYLLGMYLGDGSIALTQKGFVFIRFTLDRRFRAVARECALAIAQCSPARVSYYDRAKRGLIILQASGSYWLDFFPQHGPGKKHERTIKLVPWQLAITHQYTREFIRGLIHSDGSRCMNRFSVKLPSGRVGRYEYPRYFFTNYSADIRRIFCDHCDLLGIRWTQSNPRNISVSHRDSVAILDSFVGPKS